MRPQLGVVLHDDRTHKDVVPCKASRAAYRISDGRKRGDTSRHVVAANFNVFDDAAQLNAVGMQAQGLLRWGGGRLTEKN